jgi:hypothetical protein
MCYAANLGVNFSQQTRNLHTITAGSTTQIQIHALTHIVALHCSCLPNLRSWLITLLKAQHVSNSGFDFTIGPQISRSPPKVTWKSKGAEFLQPCISCRVDKSVPNLRSTLCRDSAQWAVQFHFCKVEIVQLVFNSKPSNI